MADDQMPPEPVDLPIDHPLRQAWLLAFATDDGGASASLPISVPWSGYVHHKNGDPRHNTIANLEIRGTSPSIMLRPETEFEAMVEHVIDAVQLNKGWSRESLFAEVAAIIQRFADGR